MQVSANAVATATYFADLIGSSDAMSEMLELAKRIAERAGKNAKVAPELLYAPILWELQDDARSSADSAQPEVWMWRATVGGVWGSWRLLDQPIDEFKKSAWGFNLGNGTAEVRALYARPERTEPQTAPSDIERAFQDACDEAGCAYDNEALLEAIHALKERCQAGTATALDTATVEACAKFIEQHQETIREAATGTERYLAPRKVGNLMGVAYVDGLRALTRPERRERE
jgi:hypothetical protein